MASLMDWIREAQLQGGPLVRSATPAEAAFLPSKKPPPPPSPPPAFTRPIPNQPTKAAWEYQGGTPAPEAAPVAAAARGTAGLPPAGSGVLQRPGGSVPPEFLPPPLMMSGPGPQAEPPPASAPRGPLAIPAPADSGGWMNLSQGRAVEAGSTEFGGGASIGGDALPPGTPFGIPPAILEDKKNVSMGKKIMGAFEGFLNAAMGPGAEKMSGAQKGMLAVMSLLQGVNTAAETHRLGYSRVQDDVRLRLSKRKRRRPLLLHISEHSHLICAVYVGKQT